MGGPESWVEGAPGLTEDQNKSRARTPTLQFKKCCIPLMFLFASSLPHSEVVFLPSPYFTRNETETLGGKGPTQGHTGSR